MNEQSMMHGKDWGGENVTGWYLSEKLDGCRAFWDGAQFWTRGGNVIEAPGRIVSIMPKGTPLDGEIYAGRGNLSVAKLATQCGRFQVGVEFVCFDAPLAPGDWQARMEFAKLHYPHCVAPSLVKNNQHLRQSLTSLWEEGGEGFIVRKPGVAYTRGRFNTVLKVKHLC